MTARCIAYTQSNVEAVVFLRVERNKEVEREQDMTHAVTNEVDVAHFISKLQSK
jgi:hypothetical protein